MSSFQVREDLGVKVVKRCFQSSENLENWNHGFASGNSLKSYTGKHNHYPSLTHMHPHFSFITHTHMHVYVHPHVRTCTLIRAYAHTHKHEHIHILIHTYTHFFTHMGKVLIDHTKNSAKKLFFVNLAFYLFPP